MARSRRRAKSGANRSSALARLSPRHRAFVRAYCGLDGSGHGIRWSPVGAARKAGYGTPHSRGTELLQREDVRAAVAEVLDRQYERDPETLERVLDELDAVATSDVGELGPYLRGEVDIEELPRPIRAAIASVSETHHPDGSVSRKVRLHPKVQAIVVYLRALEARQPRPAEPPRLTQGTNGRPVMDVPAREGGRRGLTQEQRLRAREALGIAPPAGAEPRQEAQETPTDTGADEQG